MTAPVLGPENRPKGIMDWLTTVDHKKIGLMYFWLALLFGLVGGGLAGAIRIQLMSPGAIWENMEAARISAEFVDGFSMDRRDLFSEDRIRFNRMTTMHASVMIFMVIIPAFAAFANYIVPSLSALGTWPSPR